MKKILPLIVVVFIISSCGINKSVFDEGAGKKILINECNRSAFSIKEYKTWFDKEYNSYKADENIIEKLKTNKNFKKIKIKIIFATWCGDSRREIPRFYKVLDKTGFPQENITLIAINTYRSARASLLKGVKFKRIATFIFYENNKEIGRIVETPTVSIENDWLKIISKI